MWFWIFTIIFVGLIVWWIWGTWTDNYFFETWIGRTFSTILALAVGFGLICAAWWMAIGLAIWQTPDFQKGEVTSKDLVAIQTKDTVEGRFGGSIFASYGYVNGIRVLSYISKDDEGGLRVGYSPAVNSVIYEGDEKPRIETHHWYKENGWFFPFGSVQKSDSYSFYVPTDSVVDGYEIAP